MVDRCAAAGVEGGCQERPLLDELARVRVETAVDGGVHGLLDLRAGAGGVPHPQAEDLPEEAGGVAEAGTDLAGTGGGLAGRQGDRSGFGGRRAS